MNWAAKEFRVLSLGGNRRNMRAVRLAERLADVEAAGRLRRDAAAQTAA